jgi:hypothetical protein
VPCVAVGIFQLFLVRRSFLFVFVLTTIIRSVSAICDVIIINRWNLQAGISDHAMYLLGDAVTMPVCSMLSYMPLTLLMSRISSGSRAETALFGVAAGVESFGQSVSSVMGAWLAERLGVNSGGGSTACSWEHLPLLIFIAHMAAPLLVIPFAWILLPSTAIDQDIPDAVSSCAPPSDEDPGERDDDLDDAAAPDYGATSSPPSPTN